jgi:predicted ATPase/DNA-binding CsgD family transcriptional regulator/class 3 adenylate cyclase
LNTGNTASVTFLFADPGNSLLLWEQHSKAMHAALPLFRLNLQKAIAAHQGEILNLFNDTLQAAFQSASDAVNAAIDAQRSLLSETWQLPLQPRFALLTDSSQRIGNEFLGQAPHRAARLLSVAHSGQILLCEVSASLTQDNLPEHASLLDLGEHCLPDLTRPERIYQLAAPGLPSEFPPLKTLNNQPTNLPTQPYSLVGRQPELQALTRLLVSEDVRLVTLTGIGGTGKTRLALQLAADLLPAFPDGVFLAPLDQIADPALVALALAQAYSIELTGSQSIEETIKTHLKTHKTLLVLDNFEHLLPAAPLVSRLLAACPQLKVLTTSREPLRLRGEHEFQVNPLPVPDLRQPIPLDHLAQFASVALFIQIAQAVQPDFAIDHASALAVAEICISLDGLPLAIEIIAAGVRMFTPQIILARLKAQPALQLVMTGPRDLPARQQTLEKALDWSYDLLTWEEQALFRRLGVFAGGFTIEAVESVCQFPDEPMGNILELLASLLEKSLIRRIEFDTDQTRFSMIFILRQYALKQLEEAGELAIYSDAHAVYFISLAEQVEPDDPIVFISPSDIPKEVVVMVETEEENLRAALHWSLTSKDQELGLRLVNGLHLYWYIKGREQEALYWENAVITKTQSLKSIRRAKALRNLALDMLQVNPKQHEANIEAYLAESLDLYKQLDSAQMACAILYNQGLFELSRGEGEKAALHLDKCIEEAHNLGMKYLQSIAGATRAWMHFNEGQLDEARKIAQGSVILARELHDPYAIVHSTINLGWIAYRQGKVYEALQFLSECIQFNLEIGVEIMDSLYFLAEMATCLGLGKKGAELYGAADKIREKGGLQHGIDAQFYDEIASNIRQKVGESDFDDGITNGYAQPPETISTWALEIITTLNDQLSHIESKPSNPVSLTFKHVYPAGLTAREVDTLRLLSQGLTDSQIAEILYISPRTVNAHLTSVYRKLSIKSRAAATRFALENGLV